MNLLDLMIKVGVDDQATGQLSGIGSKAVGVLGKAAKTATAAVAAVSAASVAVTKMSLDSYASYEQLVGGVDKLFGDASKQLQQYAAEAYKTSGMSANQYMEQATSFSAALISSLGGDTAKAAEQADKAMRAMSDNVNVFGSNMEDIQNAFQGFAKQNYTMLDNLKLGYGGTKAEMEHLIADANEYAASIGMASDLSIESFSDIVTAIDLIQQKQNIAGTTAKEAATTIEGSVNMAKAAWENFLTALANPETDLDASLQQLTDSIATAAGNIVPRVEIILDNVKNVVSEKLPELASFAAAYVSEHGFEMAQAALDFFLTIAGAIVDSTPQILAALALMLASLVAAVYFQVEEWVLSGVETIKGLAQGFKDGFVFALSEIQRGIDEGVQRIRDKVGSFLSAGMEVMQGLKDGIVDRFDAVKDWVTGIPSRILSALGDTSELLKDAGLKVLSGFLDGLKSKWNEVKDWFGGITAMIPKLKGPEPVDAKLLVNSGELIMQGLSKGLDEGWADVKRQLAGYTDAFAATTFDVAPVAVRAVPVSSAGFYGAGAGGATKVLNCYIDGATVNSSEEIESLFYALMSELNRLGLMQKGA